MSCGWKVMRATAAFIALVASSPAVTTGAGGIVWIAGWVGVTYMMADAAMTCDTK